MIGICRHCHGRYDVTDDLRKANASCPLCAKPVLLTKQEIDQLVLSGYLQKLETDNIPKELAVFFVDALAAQLRGEKWGTRIPSKKESQ